jgi:glucose/arabinose dehydrogenase
VPFGAFLVLTAFGPGCERVSAPYRDTTLAGSEEPAATEAAPELAREVQTLPLQPTPIHVSVGDLPEPYANESARKPPDVVPMPEDATLRAPPGFRIQVFADDLEMPRWLALTPEGDVLVTETRENRIRRLHDGDGDGVAEERSVFATAEHGLDIPFGMAFGQTSEGQWFFLGNSDEVRRYRYRDGQGQLEDEGARIAELPGGGYHQHWTRNVVVAPDGESLFVSIGSKSNASPEPLPRASIQRMGLDGEGMETFAHGLRNPVGLDFHPTTGELYTTVNERDKLGDDLVPDFFTRVRKGEFYGWPYAYLRPGLLDPRLTENGTSERPELAARTQAPDVLFQSHSAALGLAFYDGNMFPERYRQGAFVAFRGSWNRSRGTGYKLVFLPFAKGRPVGHYENFVTGFLLDPSVPRTWGRPVGVLTLPDGSLLFTEEMNGRIFRVSYDAPSSSVEPG